MFNKCVLRLSHGGDIVKIINCLYTQIQSATCNILKVRRSPGSTCGDVIYFHSFGWLSILEEIARVVFLDQETW